MAGCRAITCRTGRRWRWSPPITWPGYDVAHVVAPPAHARARETAAPIAARHTHVETDDRVIEAANDFEGERGGRPQDLPLPAHLPALPRPSVRRGASPMPRSPPGMSAAMRSALEAARGRETAIVSHQLPIWVSLPHAEGRRLWHDPCSRQCSLASVTLVHLFRGRLLASDCLCRAGRALLSDETSGVARSSAAVCLPGGPAPGYLPSAAASGEPAWPGPPPPGPPRGPRAPSGSGCSSELDSVSGQAKDGSQKNFISGDGTVQVIAPDRRLDPVTSTGTTVDGKP